MIQAKKIIISLDPIEQHLNDENKYYNYYCYFCMTLNVFARLGKSFVIVVLFYVIQLYLNYKIKNV